MSFAGAPLYRLQLINETCAAIPYRRRSLPHATGFVPLPMLEVCGVPASEARSLKNCLVWQSSSPHAASCASNSPGTRRSCRAAPAFGACKALLGHRGPPPVRLHGGSPQTARADLLERPTSAQFHLNDAVESNHLRWAGGKLGRRSARSSLLSRLRALAAIAALDALRAASSALSAGDSTGKSAGSASHSPSRTSVSASGGVLSGTVVPRTAGQAACAVHPRSRDRVLITKLPRESVRNLWFPYSSPKCPSPAGTAQAAGRTAE
jgi:hypothetical protein